MPPIPIDVLNAHRVSLVFPEHFDERAVLLLLSRLERLFATRDVCHLWVDLRAVPPGAAPFSPAIFSACIECATALRQVHQVRIAILLPEGDPSSVRSILKLLPLVSPMTVTCDADAADAFLAVGEDS